MKILLILMILVCLAIWISFLFKSSTGKDVDRVGFSFGLGMITCFLIFVLTYELYKNKSGGKFSIECNDYYVDTTTVITPYNTTQTYKIYYYKSDK